MMARTFLVILFTFIVLIGYSPLANAEYYLECYEPIPTVVAITCKANHCRWQTRHASQYHYDTRHRRNHNVEKYCNQDMATGDDNACRYPDMQIN